MSRRNFLALSAAGAAALGIAACGGRSRSSLPATPHLPIASPTNPVTLRISSDNEPIAGGRDLERGPLRIANYADYISPKVLAKFTKETGAKVEVSTFTDDVEVLSKVASGALKVDIVMSTAVDLLPRWVALKLVQPLQHDYLANETNLWDTVRNPFYDEGSRYTVPYTVFSTGIGYRTDLVDAPLSGPTAWDVLWDPRYKGAAGLLDSYREAIGIGLQHAGIPDVNTTSKADVDASIAELKKMIAATNPRIAVTGYQDIPEGTTKVNQIWSGDIYLATGYLKKGADPSVLGYWAPPVEQRVINNDAMTITRSAEHPVLAHRFIDFMLDPVNARINQEYIGYQSTLKGFEAEELVRVGAIPPNLANALVTADDFARSVRICALPPAADRVWQDAWSGLRTGA